MLTMDCRLRTFFLQWADEFYIYDEIQNELLNYNTVNIATPRKELYDSFLERNPTQRKYVTPWMDI